MPYYFYIIACADSTLYCGVTTDLTRRLREHNAGSRGAKYTRSRRPIQLLYQEAYPDRSHAQAREAEVKSWSRAKKLRLAGIFDIL